MQVPELSHIGFHRYQPSLMLKPYVQSYWHIYGKVPSTTEYLHPEGGSGLIFNFGSPFIYNQQRVTTDCIVMGPNTRTTSLTLSGYIDAVGLRFYPGTSYHFFTLPLNEIPGLPVHPDELSINLSIQPIVDSAESTIEQRLNAIESLLMQRLSINPELDKRIQPATTWLNLHRTPQSIIHLAEHLNVSARQLERLFKQWVGMTPKQFSRIKRVDYARQSLKQFDLSLTDTAYQAGYFDQAHFNHEFKQVVGLTPGQYRRRALQKTGSKKPLSA
ncbi:helix-turn-helix domain-containing protein [Neptunicella sp. SCSIO 80796]|uniref:helix-turn-helix domain-containing protein n=1 Tax=Neptunicella plasticusilytica TaxID=3117012 RepID=UPI003A4E2B71